MVNKHPGIDGIPFYGSPTEIKAGDPEHEQPQVGQHVFVKRLDLSDKQDMKTYEEVSRKFTHEHVQPSFEERKYDEDKKNWVVLIRWAEAYLYMKSQFPGGVLEADVTEELRSELTVLPPDENEEDSKETDDGERRI